MSSTPPKRDKFAALAAQQAAPKRDKFASLKQQQQQQQQQKETTTTPPNPNRARRDKFAAVQQQKQEDDRLSQKRAVLDKCKQRETVWNDLEEAEAHVIKLLQLAKDTATKLAETSDDIESSVQTGKYQDTLSKIHSLLKPHAVHVKPYVPPTRVNRMYLERVEHALADSKLRLLREYKSQEDGVDDSTTHVSKEENKVVEETDANASEGKRKREE